MERVINRNRGMNRGVIGNQPPTNCKTHDHDSLRHTDMRLNGHFNWWPYNLPNHRVVSSDTIIYDRGGTDFRAIVADVQLF